MARLVIPAPLLDDVYPERPDATDETWFDRTGKAATGRVLRALRARAAGGNRIVAKVAAVGDRYRHHDPVQLAAEASQMPLPPSPAAVPLASQYSESGGSIVTSVWQSVYPPSLSNTLP